MPEFFNSMDYFKSTLIVDHSFFHVNTIAIFETCLRIFKCCHLFL